ncbi:MAG: hypothetical protein ACJ78Q_18755, partial [Chloroflexia bacterium]
PAGLYRARSAHLVLGPLAPDPRSRTLDCPFNLNKNAGGPIHLAYITLAGLDSPDEARTPIKVALNGKSIYEGPDPLENSAPAASGRPDPWNSYSLPVDPNLLLQGANTITITNLAPSPTVPTSLTSANLPFLVLDYAAVTWMR